jgi:hypothetical protein
LLKASDANKDKLKMNKAIRDVWLVGM